MKRTFLLLLSCLFTSATHAAGWASFGLSTVDLEFKSGNITADLESDGVAPLIEGRFIADSGFTVGLLFTTAEFDQACIGSQCATIDGELDELQLLAGYTWLSPKRSAPEFEVYGGFVQFEAKSGGSTEDEDGYGVGGGVRFFAGSRVSFPLGAGIYKLDDSDGAHFEAGVDFDANSKVRIGGSVRGFSLEDEVNDEVTSTQLKIKVSLLF